jgi:hypothetical protein
MTKKNLTDNQVAALLKKWNKSKTDINSFCRQVGVKLHTMNYYRRIAKKNGIPVRTAPKGITAKRDWKAIKSMVVK